MKTLLRSMLCCALAELVSACAMQQIPIKRERPRPQLVKEPPLQEPPEAILGDVNYQAAYVELAQDFGVITPYFAGAGCPAEDRASARIRVELHRVPGDGRVSYEAVLEALRQHGLRPATFAEGRAVARTLRGRHFNTVLAALGTRCPGPAFGYNDVVPVFYEFTEGKLALNLDPISDQTDFPRKDYAFLGVAQGP